MNLEDTLLRGTRASQPAATSVGEGSLYYVTDESIIEQSRSGAWVAYSGSGSGSSSSSGIVRLLFPLPIDGEDGLDGFPIPGKDGAAGSGGGGGASIATGAYGSEPTGVTGNLYLPNNAPLIERYSGSAWVPWGPIFPLTTPIDADFSWVNQGGASVVASNGIIFLSGPAGSGVNWRIRKKAAPVTPYTITAYFLFSGFLADAHQIALIFRNSGSGIIQVFSVQTNAGAPTYNFLLNSLIYSSATAFGSVYKQAAFIPGRLIMMRIADDGTNRICSISPDGINWQVYHSVGRTTNLTADEVGFGVDTESTIDAIGITLLSWKEA